MQKSALDSSQPGHGRSRVPNIISCVSGVLEPEATGTGTPFMRSPMMKLMSFTIHIVLLPIDAVTRPSLAFVSLI